MEREIKNSNISSAYGSMFHVPPVGMLNEYEWATGVKRNLSWDGKGNKK
jgi:hypothetical protein